MRSRNTKFKNKDFTKLAHSITIGMILSMSIAGTTWGATPTSGNNLPSGNTNVIGTNDVASNGNTMTITQDKTVTNAQINWQTFDVGTDYIVNFKQQSSGATMINNVIGNNMSEIYGHINATGNVVLINPNGVLFDGATVNVGGLAVYATSSTSATDFNKDLTQGNITIKDSTITAGVSNAATLANNWGIKDYAVGITSNANRIRLVADGTVTLQGNTKLTAVDKTVATGTHIEGEEEFEMEGNASVVGPQVNIRADANSDDYGTVTINSEGGNPKIITGEAHILYNPDLVETKTYTPAEDGASVTTLYNKKNYNSEKNFNDLMDSTTVTKSTTVTTDSTGLYENATKKLNEAYTGTSNPDARMLVNNIAQLQDIGDSSTNSNLAGKYALGKDIDATSDTASFILGKTVLFRGDTTGKVNATSTVDGGVYANGGDNITKTVGGYTISYTIADTNASATVSSIKYSYNGTNYTKNDVIVADTTDWPTGLATYLSTAQGEFKAVDTTDFVKIGTDINPINSAKWGVTAAEDSTKRLGFNPIGDDGTGAGATGAFTGSFDGFGGDATHTISNLTINLGGTDGTNGQDNVGLFGVVSGGSLIRTNLSSAKIVGQNNVGGLAGQLTNGASISWSHNSGDGGINATVAAPGKGYVKVSGTGTRTNIGGLVGLSSGSTISNSGNTATIIGRTADEAVNVSRVGGIAGSMVNSSKAENIANAGNVFGENETGGLIGYGESSQIGVNNTIDNLTAASFNRGQVDGIENTGGIAGHIKDVKLHGVYNTNEDAALGTNSQYFIDANGKIVKQGGSAKTTLKDKNITSADALSKYGQVTGKDYTGGIVGLMEDSSSDNSKSEINTAYNAGNVKGTGDSTGGIVGKMTGGKVSDAYNGDNNTVIREALPTDIKQAVKDELSLTLNGTQYTFKYDATEADYYSFYTVVGGSKKYYFFKSVGDTTTKGAGGIFVDEDGKYVATLPDESTRYYLNRVGYKDANVDGTTNTGGVIGNMTGGSVDTTYNLGSVTGTAATTGALVGTLGADAAINNSFFVSGTDASIGKAYSKTTTAIGTKAGTEGTVKDYTLGDARDRTKLHTDFNNSFVGQIVNTESGTGYSLYKSGGTQYYFDNTENIYTKSGSTYTAQYTKSTETGHVGKYKGPDGYYYTYAAAADGGSFTLTPVAQGQGTTVTFTGDLVASNQSDNWLAYEEQTAPLLKYFMNTSNIDRVFAYDGTTHNLKTDDVDNLYGRADFAPGSGAGQKVQTNGYANSTKYDGSSEYYYDNSTIWSPQHGYKMNPKASVIITPVALEITLSGNKTYGDINNLKGYYISVPYYDKDASGKNTGDPHYAFYEVKKVNNVWTYELLTGTDLNTFFNGYTQDQSGIQKKADHDCKYLVTMNGIIKTEATNIDAAVKGFVEAVGGGTTETGDDFTGAVWRNKNGTKTTDTQQLNAGSYGFTTTEGAAILTGVTAQNNDYTITYDGNLKVNKANLYYTYEGIREYGDKNSTGSKTYTLVGTDDNSITKSVDGLLKSFDKDKITTSPIVISKNGTWTMTGTVATGNTNITANGTQAITQGKDGDSYYEVMVGSDGSVLGYVLKTLDSGTMKLVGKTVSGTDYTSELNNNYNLVWHVGGTGVTVNSTEAGKTGIQTATIDVNDSTQKINPVTLTINVSGARYYGDQMKAEGVTSGGNAWNNKYNVTVASGTLKNGETLLGGDVLYTTTSTITGAEKVNDVLAKIDKKYTSSATNQIDERTNANPSGQSYDVKKDSGTFTNSNITLTNSAANHNYIIKDGTDKLTIGKRNVTITATAERTYGKENDAITNKKLTQSNLTTWDSETGSNYANNQSTWQSGINVTNANIDKSTDAGTYGTNGTTNKTQALGYGTSDADKAAITNALGTNYNVTYKDLLTIDKKKVTGVTVTITGNREYGELMKDTNWTATDGWTASTDAKSTGETAAGRWNVAVTGTGVEEWDKDRINGTNNSGLNSDATKNYDLVFNSSAVTTMLGTIEDKENNAATTTGSHITYNTNASTTDYNIHSGTTYTGSNMDLTSTAYTNSLLKNYEIETNGNHALKINPKKITVTVNGERDYGSNMNTGSDDYTVTTAIPADTTLTPNKINITVDGWSSNADGDLSKTNGIKDTTTAASTLVNVIEGTYGGNKISDHTNVGTYKLDGTATGYAGSKITDEILAGIIDTKNGNYEITNNTTGHSLKIDPKAVTLTATAEKEYGNDNTLANKSLTQSGLTSWDSSSVYATNHNTWQSDINVTNANIGLNTYAGTYGTNGTTNTTQALGYGTSDADKVNITAALGTNYTVTYKDLLTIKKAKLTLNTTGSKTYGNEATTANIEHINGTGFKNSDAAILTDTLSSTFKGYVDNKKAAATINAGTYTSTDGSVLVYDAADRTKIEKAFNNNYDIDYTDSFVVNKRNLELTTSGSRIYGKDNTGLTYTFDDTKGTDSGLTTWDRTAVDAVKTTWNANVTNNTVKSTDAGTYSKSSGDLLGLILSEQTVKDTNINSNTATMDDNYTITYKDSFTINQKPLKVNISGERIYGDENSTTHKIGDTATKGYVITDVNGSIESWDAIGDKALAGLGTFVGTDFANIKNNASKTTNADTTGYTDKLSFNDKTGLEGVYKNYNVTYSSKYVIDPAAVTISVEGNKVYGNATSSKGTDYTFSVNGMKNNQTLLLNNDTTTVTNTTTDHSNAGTYGKGGTLVNVITGVAGYTGTTGFDANNYTITLDTANNKYTIHQREVYLTTKGSKTYGDADPAGSAYEITDTSAADANRGLTSWDETATINSHHGSTNYTAWQNSVTNSTDEKSDAKSYGTVNGSDKVLGLDVGNTYINTGTNTGTNSGSAKMSTNYIITYKDDFNIGKKAIKIKVTGSKIYGENTINGTNTGNVYTVTADALQNGDKFDTSKVIITNTVGEEANVGTYKGADATHIIGADNFVNDESNTDKGNHEFKAGNYDITFDAVNSQYDVTKRSLTVETTGSKTYGDADPAGGTYTVKDISTGAASGLTTWDQGNFNTTVATAKNTNAIGNNTDEHTNVGSYGTKGNGTQALTVDVTAGNNLATNYIITYVDKFDIGKRKITVTQTGTKEYGTGSEHSTYSKVGLDNVANGQ